MKIKSLQDSKTVCNSDDYMGYIKLNLDDKLLFRKSYNNISSKENILTDYEMLENE